MHNCRFLVEEVRVLVNQKRMSRQFDKSIFSSVRAGSTLPTVQALHRLVPVTEVSWNRFKINPYKLKHLTGLKVIHLSVRITGLKLVNYAASAGFKLVPLSMTKV